MSTSNSVSILRKTILICVLITTLVIGVYAIIAAKSLLAPVVLALMLAMLTVPMVRWLERRKVPKVLSSAIAMIAVVVVTLGITILIFIQFSKFLSDSGDIQGKFEQTLESVEQFLVAKTPLEQESLENVKSDYGLPGSEEGEDDEGNEKPQDVQQSQQEAASIVGTASGFLADWLLMYVYVFLFVHYRGKFFTFLVKLFPARNRRRVTTVARESLDMVYHYVVGRLILMVVLTGLYSLGLMISGVENFLLVSMIAAVLSIIPFIGNMIGYLIALIIGLGSGGDMQMVIGISATFLAVQLIETYVIQPLLLGNKLNVNPFFIIFSVLVGNAIWGIVGIVLAIPLFAIVTILCNKVPALEAFGYLFRNEKDG